MGREILFKAKHIHTLSKNKHLNGRWIYGYLCSEDYISSPELRGEFLIDKNTICQYTGLTDKNGARIWENDILKGYEYPFYCDGEFNYFAQACWSEESKCFGLYTVKNKMSSVRGIFEGNFELLEYFDSEQWEVIGNIFDKPELLEEK